MEVIDIGDRNTKKRREELLEVLEDLKARVEAGEIKEFVAASMNTHGDVQIHASILDTAGGIGLFEIGKHILITQAS
jgi:hypothetical protein